MTSISQSAVLYGDVKYGASVDIGPNVVIYGPVVLGNGVKISAGVVIGEPGEHRLQQSDHKMPIVIGERTVIREYAVIQRGLVGGDGTRIGANCYIMHGAHIAHDCRIGDDVTITPHVTLAGHVIVQKGANLGLNSCVHQFCTVGPYAMVCMGSAVHSDVLPGIKVIGNPARFCGRNGIGLSRAGIEPTRFDKMNYPDLFEQYLRFAGRKTERESEKESAHRSAV